MKRSRNPDAELFRDAVRDVKPMAHNERVAPPRQTPKRPRLRRADRLAARLEENLAGPPAPVEDETLSYRRPGVQDAVLRRLRRGQFPVQAELDLHGLTGAQATRVLQEFLAEALAAELRCVRIVHGKGTRSGERGPVLRRVAHDLLRRSGFVMAFVPAAEGRGGTGAVHVLLAVDR